MKWGAVECVTRQELYDYDDNLWIPILMQFAPPLFADANGRLRGVRVEWDLLGEVAARHWGAAAEIGGGGGAHGMEMQMGQVRVCFRVSCSSSVLLITILCS